MTVEQAEQPTLDCIRPLSFSWSQIRAVRCMVVRVIKLCTHLLHVTRLKVICFHAQRREAKAFHDHN